MLASVIIPVYNGAATVGEAIRSVLAQDLGGTEIVVVDDGSTDSTPEVLAQFGSSIKAIRRKNGGLCAARNSGVAAASGEYIALLDADDVWRPGRLSKTVEALERNPEAVLAFCDYVPMDSSGKMLQSSSAGRAPSHGDLLKRAWPIVPSAVTIRRSALEKAGGFCEEFKGCAGGEDQYMWLLLSELGLFEYVPEALVIHRRTPPMETVDKYEPGRRTFVRLVRQRYGARASSRIQEGKNYFAGILLSGAVAESDAGHLLTAFKLASRALRFRPALAFDQAFLTRVLSPRTLQRLKRSLFNSAPHSTQRK